METFKVVVTNSEEVANLESYLESLRMYCIHNKSSEWSSQVFKKTSRFILDQNQIIIGIEYTFHFLSEELAVFMKLRFG